MSKTTFVRVLSRSLSFYWTGLGFAVKVVVEGTRPKAHSYKSVSVTILTNRGWRTPTCVVSSYPVGGHPVTISDSVLSKDALLSHKRERKRTGIPLNPCLVGRGVVPTAR